MGGEDFRTKPLQDGAYTYYVFDNLRCNQDHAGGDIFRYDTVEEAIGAFQRVQATHPDWTIALGGSVNGVHEIDYIQRRDGENCLITDYQKLDAFKDSPEVRRAIETAMVALRVDWQVDHELTGSSILVPQEFDAPSLDSYLSGLRLRSTGLEDALASIQEVFAERAGWIDLKELGNLARFANDERPKPPRVTRFNVAYQSRDPLSNRTGYVDISPSDLRIMKQEYQEALRETEALKPKTMEGWRVFAEETHEYSMYAYLQKGDVVGEDVVNYFVNMLPPATNRASLVQIGSPYDSVEDRDGKLRPTFGTFAKENGVWRFCGNCFRGERVEPAQSTPTKESWRDMISEAKEKATSNNIDRPKRQRLKSHDLER